MSFLYLGPGFGGETIALILGYILSFLVFMAGIVIIPIKYVLRKFRKKKD